MRCAIRDIANGALGVPATRLEGEVIDGYGVHRHALRCNLTHLPNALNSARCGCLTECHLDRPVRYPTARGYRNMLAARRRWRQRVWAVEGCQGVGRHLAQRLPPTTSRSWMYRPSYPRTLACFSTAADRSRWLRSSSRDIAVGNPTESADGGGHLTKSERCFRRSQPCSAEIQGGAGRA